MHVAVCLNYIPDPEAPAKQFRLDEQTNRPALQRTNRVMGPFDENALEIALQLKDAFGAKVTALTAGPGFHQEMLRKALGVRADAAVHVVEEQVSLLDPLSVAQLLAGALRRLGGVDLVLCGRESGEWDGGQVGQLLAEELGFACACLARQIEPAGGEAVRVTREVAGGVAVVEATLPAVVTVTNSASNQLRIPKVKDTMAAFRIPITSWSPSDAGFSPASAGEFGRLSIRRMYLPDTSVRVEMIEGDGDEERATKLASRLTGLKLF